MPKPKKPSIKRIEQLHPLQREKELRKLLLENKNKKFLRIITEQIEKAELEQEHLESSKKEPKKTEEPKELDTLVKKEAENLEEEKKEKVKIGKLYGIKLEEHHGKEYQTYTTYAEHKEELKIELQSTTPTNTPQFTPGSTEESIKKTTELYMKKKQEKHEH
ncbi:MAG: hypothetical protein AABW58_01465 [Nanoarchaeota archaeon]